MPLSLVEAAPDDFWTTVSGFGEDGWWEEADFGVVCGVRVTGGLARGDLLFVCKVALGVTGDAGIDLLVPPDFINGEELAVVFSGVVLLCRPVGLDTGTEPAPDFRGPCGLILPNIIGGDRRDNTGDPVCCFGVSFGEVDGSRPVNDFRLPRTGFGPVTSGDGG